MTAVAAELSKLPAFLRRDFLVAWSYRMSFFSDFIALATQMFVFAFIGRLVSDNQLPSYNGAATTYVEFVAIGLVVNLFVQIALTRTATAIRTEQMIGTLEALLVTPTSPTTVQAGSVAFDLLFIPFRMAVLLVAVAVTLGLGFELNGVLPSLVLLIGFVPFVWGLGLVAAGAIVTFRHGGGVVGLAMTVLGLVSGAFFPLALLPAWLEALAKANPVAIAMEGTREALIGGAGWEGVGTAMLILVPLSSAALFAGVVAFRAALAREHRRGTLGLY
jgi:ABC-2 type transport system permease protein